jgi:hypothetical protein
MLLLLVWLLENEDYTHGWHSLSIRSTALSIHSFTPEELGLADSQ